MEVHRDTPALLRIEWEGHKKDTPAGSLDQPAACCNKERFAASLAQMQCDRNGWADYWKRFEQLLAANPVPDSTAKRKLYLHLRPASCPWLDQKLGPNTAAQAQLSLAEYVTVLEDWWGVFHELGRVRLKDI